jgi:hypothetical protein
MGPDSKRDVTAHGAMSLDPDVECVATALRVHEPSGVVVPMRGVSTGPEGRRAGTSLVPQVQTPSRAAGHRQRDRAPLAHNDECLQPPPSTAVVAELVDLRPRRVDQDDPVPDDEIIGIRRQWWIPGGGLRTTIARRRDSGAPCRCAGGEPDRDSNTRSDNGSDSRGHSVPIHRRRDFSSPGWRVGYPASRSIAIVRSADEVWRTRPRLASIVHMRPEPNA